MSVRKASVSVEGEARLFFMDVIEHDGKRWLVAEWSDTPSQKRSKPKRLILLDSLQHQKIDPPSVHGDFAVNNPIPKAVLAGRVQQQQGFGYDQYVVLEGPDITVDRTATARQ